MGYDVEWRVINASEYGMPQQRRRVFIMAYRTQDAQVGKSVSMVMEDLELQERLVGQLLNGF